MMEWIHSVIGLTLCIIFIYSLQILWWIIEKRLVIIMLVIPGILGSILAYYVSLDFISLPAGILLIVMIAAYKLGTGDMLSDEEEDMLNDEEEKRNAAHQKLIEKAVNEGRKEARIQAGMTSVPPLCPVCLGSGKNAAGYDCPVCNVSGSELK